MLSIIFQKSLFWAWMAANSESPKSTPKSCPLDETMVTNHQLMPRIFGSLYFSFYACFIQYSEAIAFFEVLTSHGGQFLCTDMFYKHFFSWRSGIPKWPLWRSKGKKLNIPSKYNKKAAHHAKFYKNRTYYILLSNYHIRYRPSLHYDSKWRYFHKMFRQLVWLS